MDIPKTLEELRVEHEEEFRKAILDLYRRAKEEHGYKPTLLLQMVQQYGPYAAATKIIEIPGQSSGFTKLWELKALELSVEALVWEKYRYLFPPEIVDTCRETLRTYGYFKDKDMMQEMSGSSSEERSATLMPTGNETPQRIQSTAARYERDSMIVAETKRLAKGKCQLCGQDAPFKTKNEEPYLECHHIVALAEGGADTMQNTVALCPNCHTKMHMLNLEEDRERLLRIAASRT